MTTAAQKLAEYGITMELAHEWLLANLSSPAGILAVCANFGVTNAMLGEIAAYPNAAYSANDVKAFFQAHGLNSSSLDATGSASVTAVNDATADEGQGIYLNVELAAATTEPTLIPVSFGFDTASMADLSGAYQLNYGVTFDGSNLLVPAGVEEFLFIITAANDTADEALEETFSIHIGGVTATGTILDDDEPPAPIEGSALLTSYMDGFAPLLDLNDRTGDLSNAALRARVLTNAALTTNYLNLFNPARFQGSEDGFFTPEELGVSHLGTIAATTENIESLFFGTYFDIVQSLDIGEVGPIGTFFMNNLVGIVTKNPTVMQQYANLFIEAAADPASPQASPDSYYATMVTLGLQNLAATGSPTVNVFDSLMTI